MYQNIFRSRYTLKGKDWIRRISPDDLMAFIRLGMMAWDYGRMGGLARAKTARRDAKGRFIRNDYEIDYGDLAS